MYKDAEVKKNVKYICLSMCDVKVSDIYFTEYGYCFHLIQPTISLEMPVPSQGHYGFHSFPVVD